MMNIKETKKIISKRSQEAKKKYPGDAADWAFRAHVLKLLEKIAKMPVESEEEPTPQKAGLNLFKCKNCDGDGYVECWDDYRSKEAKIISDCTFCKGKGHLELQVIDKRKVTKEQDLYFNQTY